MANIKDVLGWFNKNNQYLEGNNSYDRRMKLLKLMFLSHGFYGSKYNEQLFSARFEAWRDGPVDNQAYAKHINHDYNYDVSDEDFTEEELEVMRRVNDIYGIYSGEALSDITHQFSSWFDTYVEDENGVPLPHLIMPEHKIRKDFEIASKNLYKFTDYSKDNIIQIYNGVSVVIKTDQFNEFENRIDLIHEDFTNKMEYFRNKKEFLVFLDFDDLGVLNYEL